MSLRSLGPLLARRLLSPGTRISRGQANKALAPAAGVQARSLHSLRDFAVGDSAGAYSGVAAAVLAGLVRILYIREGADESPGEVTKAVVAGEEETNKEVAKAVVAGEKETKVVKIQEAKKHLAGDEARKQIAGETKEHHDDDFSLEEYLAEMTKIAAEEKKARFERSCKKGVKEVTNSEAINDETAMKARFEEWIKEYGKKYENKDEKARRYELFKAFAIMVDKATAQGGAIFVTNHNADWTEEECRCLYDDDVDWDDYLDHIRSLIDKKNARAKKPSRD